MPQDPRKMLDEAFETFEVTLRAALEAEAHRSIDAYLKMLDDGGRYRVDVANVSVTVAGLRLTSDDDAARPEAAKRAKQARPAKGRAASPARRAILELLAAEPEKAWSITEIREGLEASHVAISVTNMHQLLRRLSAADAVERVGRGQYRFADAAAA